MSRDDQEQHGLGGPQRRLPQHGRHDATDDPVYLVPFPTEPTTFNVFTKPFRVQVTHLWRNYLNHFIDDYGTLQMRLSGGFTRSTGSPVDRFWSQIFTEMTFRKGQDKLTNGADSFYQQCVDYFRDEALEAEVIFLIDFTFGLAANLQTPEVRAHTWQVLNTCLKANNIPYVYDGTHLIPEDAPPSWALEMRLLKVQQLEAEIDERRKEIEALDSLLALLHGTGNALEDAVVQALKMLGVDAKRTEKGFTADVVAHTMDQSMSFGVEVTGVNGPIRKDSNKPTQARQFYNTERKHNDKVIILANTYRHTPVQERGELTNFTPEAVQATSGIPVLLMTGVDLYRMVEDVMEGKCTSEDALNILYTSTGVLQYSR